MLERHGIPKDHGYLLTSMLCNQYMREDGMTNFVRLTINDTGRP